MSKVQIARVAIESPLPQLDRLFDYVIPEHLVASCVAGARVTVPFGKATTDFDGFVVEIATETQQTGQLSQLTQVISSVPVLQANQYKILRAVADRQAATLSELTKLAIPKRSVRVEKTWLANHATSSASATNSDRVKNPESATNADSATSSSGKADQSPATIQYPNQPTSFAGRNTILCQPRLVNAVVTAGVAGGAQAQTQQTVLPQNVSIQGWIAVLCHFAANQLNSRKSAILLVPDFRDQSRLLEALQHIGFQDQIVNLSTTQVPSARYQNYLRCLETTPVIAIGSRAAVFAPVFNLGGIAMWDDVDGSFQEPTSPYLHTREIALLRQQTENCDLLLAGHSRSVETQRLIDLDYVQDITVPFAPPKIAVTEPGLRIDSTSFQAAKRALDAGRPVLVQVSNTGHSTGTYCADCSARSQCKTCNGPLFVDSQATPRCRWCSAINLATVCLSCGGKRVRQGLAGSQRTAAELGKAFPGVQVVEATAQNRIQTIRQGKVLVVATPGAEPYAPNGYGAVILLDGQRLLAKDTLRAIEIAVENWSNAVSLMAGDGLCVGVGLAGPLGQKFALWSQQQIARDELAGRRELGFPPHLRMATVTGPQALVNQMVQDLPQLVAKPDAIQVLGPLNIGLVKSGTAQAALFTESQWRYIIRFEYSVGEELAKELKSRALKINANHKGSTSKAGKLSRAVKVKMDDSEVI